MVEPVHRLKTERGSINLGKLRRGDQDEQRIASLTDVPERLGHCLT